MQSTPSFAMFFVMEAHHPESVSTMLALLANFFFVRNGFLLRRFYVSESARTSCAMERP
jgi:hypothetical protein